MQRQFATGSKTSFPFLFHFSCFIRCLPPPHTYTHTHTRKPLSFRGLIKGGNLFDASRESYFPFFFSECLGCILVSLVWIREYEWLEDDVAGWDVEMRSWREKGKFSRRCVGVFRDMILRERKRVLCLVSVCWRVSYCCSCWIELHGFVFLLRVW